MKKKAHSMDFEISEINAEIEQQKEEQLIEFLARIIVKITINECNHENSYQIPSVQQTRSKP
ncbi:hypothetical protein [Sinomicrobium sp. M5D2P9]